MEINRNERFINSLEIREILFEGESKLSLLSRLFRVISNFDKTINQYTMMYIM